MKIIEIVLESVLYINILLFPLSTILLINKAKKTNYNLVKKAVKNPILSNFDLGFFEELRFEYIMNVQKKSLAILNKISQYSLVLSFVMLLILSIFTELFRY